MLKPNLIAIKEKFIKRKTIFETMGSIIRRLKGIKI